jgi:hypothetical protein
MTRGAALTLAALALTSPACRNELDQYKDQGPRYEARSWLRANLNPDPFASNRFESKAAIVAFVDSLYQLGADTVYVLNVSQEPEQVQQEGGPYADALLVRLPSERTARDRLFAVQAREARGEGFDPDPDRGQRYLYFWWD